MSQFNGRWFYVVLVILALGCSKPTQQASAPDGDLAQEAAPDSPPESTSVPLEDAVVELSDPKLTRALGGRKTFSVAYRFTHGEPSSATVYRLVIKNEGGSGREVVMIGMPPTGTIKDEQLDPNDLAGTKPLPIHTAHLEIHDGSAAKVISNEVTAEESAP